MHANLPRFVEYGRVSSAGQERRQTQEGQVVALERLRVSRPGLPVLTETVFECSVPPISTGGVPRDTTGGRRETAPWTVSHSRALVRP